MFCTAPSGVNYPSIIVSIDENIVRLRIISYYLNVVKFLDNVFDLTCHFLLQESVTMIISIRSSLEVSEFGVMLIRRILETRSFSDSMTSQSF